MAQDRSLSAASPADYESIERAVTETARGRWFLDEHLRRNRGGDSHVLLDAVERLHRAVAGEPSSAVIPSPHVELATLADLIAEAEARITAAPFADLRRDDADRFEPLRRANHLIATNLAAIAARIRGLAAALRDHGGPVELSDELDNRAVEVAAAAQVQALVAERAGLMADCLSEIGVRVDDLLDGGSACAA